MKTSLLQILNRIPRNYLVLAILAVLVVLFYGNTLFNDFVYDDIGGIVINEYVHSLKYLPKAITTCFWGDVYGNVCGSGGVVYYRVSMALMFMFTYFISSSAWFFHLLHLLYFLSIVFLVYLLVKLLTKDHLLALLTAVLFLVHPINSEVANFISTAPEVSYAIFILLATFFYVRYRWQSQTSERQSNTFNRNKNFLLALFFYALGMFSKEPAVLFPIVVVSLDFIVFKMSFVRLLSFREVRKYLAFAFVFLFYFIARLIIFRGIPEPQPFFVFTIPERLYAFFELSVQYITKLLYPYPLLAFYTFEKKADFLSGQFLFLVSVVFLFIAALYFFIVRDKKLHAFFLVWFVVFLLPVLLFIDSTGENIFSERYLLLSSISFVFVLSSGITYIFRYPHKLGKPTAIAIMVVIVISSWLIIFPRNKEWKDNEILYTATLEQNPNAHLIRFDRAVEWATQNGDFAAAKREFEEIERRDPHWFYIFKVYNNLGDVYQMEGDIEKAIEYYQKSIDTAEGARAPLYNTIGVLYAKQEQYFAALPYFCKAVQSNPQFEGVQENFSRIISILEIQKEEDPEVFYENLLAEKTFSPSSIEKIRFMQEECSEEACIFSFISRLEPGEAILPFLIQGATSSGEVLLLREPVFNLQTGVITIESDVEYEEQTISFMFPTCDGVYYEAETAVEP